MNANERRANERAADRLLKRAIGRAVEIIADADRTQIMKFGGGVVGTAYTYDRRAVVAMLAAAGKSAALLLGEA